MKKIILLALIAGSMSLTSCKLTKCDCPPGKSFRTNGSTDEEIRQNCEFNTNGVCTY